MKLMKSIFGLALVLAAAAFSACSSDDEYDYVPGEAKGQQVYFPSDLETTIYVSKSASSATVTLRRIDTAEELTVPIAATCEGGDAYSFPASVTFPAGKAAADYVITYDPDAIAYDDFKELSLRIADEAYTTPYGHSSFTGTIGAIAYGEWEKYGDGTCTYTYNAYYAGDDSPLSISRRTSVTDKNVVQFRISGWFDGGDGGIDLFVECNSATGVAKVSPQATTTAYYGYVVSVCDNNTFKAEIGGNDDTGAYGSYDAAAGIITLPMTYYLPDYDNFELITGEETITIDGDFERSDYSADVAYAGKFIDGSENLHVVANAWFGADVASAKAAVLPADFTEETVMAIADGSYAGDVADVKVTATGQTPQEIRIPSDGLATGKYSVVLLSFDEDGAMRDFSYADFVYIAGGTSSWSELAKGTYTYSVFFGTDEEPQAEAASLFKSDDFAGTYKLAPWGAGAQLQFTMDAAGGILVESQPTGYEVEDYGMVYVADLTTADAAAQPSSYDPATGIYTFSLIYYLDDGTAVADGTETFDPNTGAATSSVKMRRASSAKIERKAHNGNRPVALSRALRNLKLK